MKTWEGTVWATMFALMLCAGAMLVVSHFLTGSPLRQGRDAPILDLLAFFGIYFAMGIPVTWVFVAYLSRQEKRFRDK